MYKRQALAGAGAQVEAFDERDVLAVAEIDVFYLYIAARVFERGSIFGIGGLLLKVDDLEHAARRGHGALQFLSLIHI